MARRLVIASQKGGVGKTTVALNLAVALAQRGRRVRLVDLDPQGGITLALGRGETEQPGLAELILGHVTPETALLRTHQTGLSILPRGRLDPADACEFEQALFRPGVLEEALRHLESETDLVVLDAPAGLGLVTRAVLSISDFVLVPFQTHALSLRSVGQVLRVIEHVESQENPRLRLLGILPTLVEEGKSASAAVLAEVWNGFPVLASHIPYSESIQLASHHALPVAFLAGHGSEDARRFGQLAEEVERLMDRLTRGEHTDDLTTRRDFL
jgi:chromosome partitioning protein